MDFQPTAQPLVAGRLGWVGRGEPGWIWGLAAASMPRTPPPSPPARPLTHCGGSARHGKKKEDQEQKRHSRYPCPASIQQISSTHGVDLPCRPRSTPTGNRDLPTVTGKLSGVGRCGLAGPLAPWMAPSSPQGRVYGVSCQSTPPRPTSRNPEPHWLWLWLWPLRVQGAALQRKRPPFGGLTSHYFSLISRRRSSRKPWAVIASGYRLGFSGVMQDGSTSIR